MALVGSELTAVGSVPTAAGSDSPGEGGGASTLVATYAAGAASPITDDLMAMLHGNMRFQSTVDAHPLPLLAYFDGVAGQADDASGYPSELWSLGIDLGGGAFGRRYAVYQMFDPTWNGTFAQINGKSWETERVTFTADGTNEYQSQTQNPCYGSRLWKIFNQYPSIGFPQGVTSNGTVKHQTELYNTVDLGLRLIDELDGWGQTNRELTPQTNGITWQWATHWNAANLAGAPNDGTGWGVYYGDIDHSNFAVAGLAAQQVTGDPHGAWYWAMYVADGSGGLTQIGTFSETAITLNAELNVGASWGMTAPGATTVTITNSPGAGAHPTEYLAIKNTSGQTRYIPLLS